MKSQVGMKPTSKTVIPMAIQAVRQLPRVIAASAIKGRQTRPDICASVAMPVASVRRTTNQLLTAL